MIEYQLEIPVGDDNFYLHGGGCLWPERESVDCHDEGHIGLCFDGMEQKICLQPDAVLATTVLGGDPKVIRVKLRYFYKLVAQNRAACPIGCQFPSDLCSFSQL
jgi:hypothetical protein